MPTKILSAFALALLLVSCAEEQNNNLLSISGQVIDPISEEASFIFSDSTYSANLDENGSFTIDIEMDSAAYISFKHGFETTAMYVKPGDKINLTINPEQFDETIQYEGSITSSFLAQKYLIQEEGDFYGEPYYLSTEEEYQGLMDAFKAELVESLDQMDDTTFVQAELANIDEDIEFMVNRQKNMSEYTMDVRGYMMNQSNLSRDYNFYGRIDSLDQLAYALMLDEFVDTMKVFLQQVEDVEYVKSEEKKLDARRKSWMERKTQRDNMPQAGDVAIDFTYPDTTGQNYSLSSFEGNLVYVDVWATWCGPCKAEIPSLQQLEADYHDQAITFLSVSVDTDEAAWRKMVQDKSLGGTQLWADGWSQITKDYAIFGIPRFMLFSADGKVISNDAPRPSSADIRDLFDANL
jgi:thiol-disulfide isomerase/thioredoxin